MNSNTKFSNGLSIIQLEVRYEMVAVGRSRGSNEFEEPLIPEMFPNFPF